MIIFDLDGTLADCEHRRHFVDPTKSVNHLLQGYDGSGIMIEEAGVYCNIIDGKRFKPDYKLFYEACDLDKPIIPTIKIFKKLWDSYETPIQIWSGRCESVRNKTQSWLIEQGLPVGSLKMRPLGDSTPDDELKERWLDEYMFGEKCHYPTLEGAIPINKVDFVFDDRPKVIRMWRRRGVFVFNCCQHSEEF